MKNKYILISLFCYLIIYDVVALAVTPYLNEIKPNKVLGCVYPREFSLSGGGFANNMRVEIIASGVNKILEKEKVTFINSNSAKIKINTMVDPDNWYIRVSNGNGSFSNTANFVVNNPPAFPVFGELGSIIGQFKGVDAKSNGACTGKLTGLCGTNYLCEAPHQCVQYAKEYYKKNYPHISEIDSQWFTAKTFWERSKHLKLTKTIYSQNGLKKDELPQTGDMIFFDTGHAAGHVAIVTSVDDNEISIIQQNIDRYNAFDSLKIVNDKNTGLVLIDKLRGQYSVLGWLTPNIQTQGAIAPTQSANNYINGQLKTFDGEWHSPVYNYSFLINGRNGVATLSNSRMYQVGDNMLKISQVKGNSFTGSQIYTDGNWYPVSGFIDSNGVLKMKGIRVSWSMIKNDTSASTLAATNSQGSKITNLKTLPIVTRDTELKSQPTLFSSVSGQLKRGEKVHILEIVGDWIKVKTTQGQGYVYSDSLR